MEAITATLGLACAAAALVGIALGRMVFRAVTEAKRGQQLVSKSGAEGSFAARVLRSGVGVFNVPAQKLLGVQACNHYAQRVCEGVESLGYQSSAQACLSLVLCACGISAVLASLAAWSPVCGIAAVSCVLLGLGAWSSHRKETVRADMREGIPEALQSMKACFQVGYSLPQTIKEVRRATSGHLSTLFGEVEGVLETGGSIDEALEVLKRKGGEPELVFLAAALEIQHKTGSSMAAVLEATRQSVADEIDLKRSLRTQTAQAKLSAQVVTVMPFALIGVFSLVSPGFLSPFFESAMGLVLLAVALGMQALGIVLVRKMLKVEVA